VRDTLTGTTTLVSRAAGADGVVANANTFGATISADGTKVAYYSSATNLVPGVTTPAIYERDLATGAMTVVSRGDGVDGTLPSHDHLRDPPPQTTTRGAPAADGTATTAPGYSSQISADGTKVAFVGSNPLTPDAGTAHPQVYVRDLAAGTTTLVSRADGAAGT